MLSNSIQIYLLKTIIVKDYILVVIMIIALLYVSRRNQVYFKFFDERNTLLKSLFQVQVKAYLICYYSTTFSTRYLVSRVFFIICQCYCQGDVYFLHEINHRKQNTIKQRMSRKILPFHWDITKTSQGFYVNNEYLEL